MFYNRFCELCAEHHVAPTTFTENVLGMSKGNVSKWKEGKPPKSDTIQKIAAYFGVSTDYLLVNTDIKNKPAVSEDDELNQYMNDPELKRAIDIIRKLNPDFRKSALDQLASIEALQDKLDNK